MTPTRKSVPGAGSLDKHPLRYSLLAEGIEQILLRRIHANLLDGYTLETAIELSELAVRALQTVDCALVVRQIDRAASSHDIRQAGES